MVPIVRSSEIARVDYRSQKEAQIPELLLMESAGLQAWQMLKPHLKEGERLLFLVGGGNNGGDALVMSRYAYHQGYTNQRILYLGTSISPACKQQRLIIATYPIGQIGVDEVEQWLGEGGWVIDGIAGTGVRGPLKESLRPLVALINASGANVFSIDIPSGLGDEVGAGNFSIKATMTVTMGARKLASYHPATRQRSGKIIVINPSFPPALLEQVMVEARLLSDKPTLSALGKEEYKKSRGHLGIWGGSEAYSGALRLASRSAFAARGGLVTLVCDQEIMGVVANESPSAIIRPLGEADPSVYDALLVGPGWGDGRQAVLQALLESKRPMVIDADGIRAFATHQGPVDFPVILTPHLGELQVLLDEKIDELSPLAFFERIKGFARSRNVTLVVKSSLTHIVTQEGEVWVVEGGNPSLGVAGSGDVLGGIVAALLAKYQNPVLAAVQGVLIHQRSGQLAHESLGYYDSEQLISFVGKACREAEG